MRPQVGENCVYDTTEEEEGGLGGVMVSANVGGYG